MPGTGPAVPGTVDPKLNSLCLKAVSPIKGAVYIFFNSSEIYSVLYV